MKIDLPNIVEIAKTINNITVTENTVEVNSTPTLITVNQPQNSVTIASTCFQVPEVQSSFFLSKNPLTRGSFLANLTAGHNIIYTVPAGRCAMIYQTACYYHGTGTTKSIYPEIRLIDLSYIKTNHQVTLSPKNLHVAANNFSPTIFVAGESLAVYASADAEISARATVWEFDAENVTSVRLISYGAGYTEMYTIPVGKFIVPVSRFPETNWDLLLNGYATQISPYLSFHIVPPDASPSDATKINNSTYSWFTNSGKNISLPVIDEGYSYVIESDGTGVACPLFLAFLEYDK